MGNGKAGWVELRKLSFRDACISKTPKWNVWNTSVLYLLFEIDYFAPDDISHLKGAGVELSFFCKAENVIKVQKKSYKSRVQCALQFSNAVLINENKSCHGGKKNLTS